MKVGGSMTWMTRSEEPNRAANRTAYRTAARELSEKSTGTRIFLSSKRGLLTALLAEVRFGFAFVDFMMFSTKAADKVYDKVCDYLAQPMPTACASQTKP